jgi:hypothetical protein
MSSLPDPPEQSEPFYLSDSVASVGDPVGGHPFPIDDALHTVWSEATRTAEEAVRQLMSGTVIDQPSGAAREWPATRIVATFDAWAQRGASVVWSDRSVEHYHQWGWRLASCKRLASEDVANCDSCESGSTSGCARPARRSGSIRQRQTPPPLRSSDHDMVKADQP